MAPQGIIAGSLCSRTLEATFTDTSAFSIRTGERTFLVADPDEEVVEDPRHEEEGQRALYPLAHSVWPFLT
jgi:hypothetical protein